jgi:hypothetical protein
VHLAKLTCGFSGLKEAILSTAVYGIINFGIPLLSAVLSAFLKKLS